MVLGSGSLPKWLIIAGQVATTRLSQKGIQYMLQQMSYQKYYNSLSAEEWKKLQELHDVPSLPVPAVYVVELERHGYTLDIQTGEVLLDVGGRVLECGNVGGFAALLRGIIQARAEIADGEVGG